jgi:molybdopterin converting factor small subunit
LQKKYQSQKTINIQGHQNMQVKVHYISLVKSYTNKSQEEITLTEDASMAELLNQIANIYGKQFKEEVYDPIKKEMKSTFVALVNGVLMDQIKGTNTTLKNGDNIILMSLMTGG